MTCRWTALKLTLMAVAVALLGLVPNPQAFAMTMRAAEAERLAREYGAALDHYRQAARLDPESPLPWLKAGSVLLDQHRFVQASSAFQEAERLGGRETALLGLGESLAGRGDWAGALQTWLHARALAPQDARIHVALGRGNIAQSRFDQALRHLVAALNCQPAAGPAAAARALIGRLLAADDPAQAADHFRLAGDQDMLAILSALEAEPAPDRRDLLLGAAFLQRGELPLARWLFERAVARSPFASEPHAYLAHTLDRLGETAAARGLLDRALALDPESTLAYYFLGVHELKMGNVQPAQAALWEAILRDPENAALHVEMAKAFVELGDYAHAGEWYRRAAEAAPENVDFQIALVHFYLDHLYSVQERGVPAAQAALALAPEDPRVYDLLGWAYYLTASPGEAEEAFLQALALDPDLVSAHYHLGSLYAWSGQRDLARQHLRRAADLDTTGVFRVRAEALLDDWK